MTPTVAVGNAVVALVFLCVGFWSVRGYLRDGRAPYWRGITSLLYVERLSNPVGFWTQITFATVVALAPAAYVIWLLCSVGIRPSLPA
jgi:hypothetical protein